MGLWKAIGKEWDILSRRLAFQVGNGQIVRFCRDKGCGVGHYLSSSLPYLPSL